jgi:hypothetical protein
LLIFQLVFFLLFRLLLFLVCGFGGADAAVVGLVGFWFGG